MTKNDIRSGPIAPTIIRLSLPILAGQAFMLLYNLVDTFFISQIDTADPWLVGATGLVWPLYFIFMATSFGITGGVSSLVARAIGAQQEKELDRTAESGLFLAIVVSIVSLALMYPFGKAMLQLFGGTEQLLEYGLEYFHWLLPTIPFMMLSAVFTGILQGEGRTRHMMVSMMIGTIVNIVMDPILIFGLNMGIGGAGLATAIGNATGFIYLFLVFLFTESKVKIHWKIKNISFPVIAEIIRVGLPQSLMNFLASISFIFYNRIMIDINPMIITAFTLYSRLEQLAMIPIWAITSGLSAVAGQAAGAHDYKRMRKSSRVSSQLGLGVSGLLFIIYVSISPWLFRVFQSDPEVLSLAGIIVIWMAGASLVSIPMFMINTVMSVAGFANRSLLYTAIRIYVLNVPACIIGAYIIGRNLQSTMIAIFLSTVLSLILMLLAEHHFFNSLESGRIKVRTLKQDKIVLPGV